MQRYLKKTASKYLLAFNAQQKFHFSSTTNQFGGYVPVYKFPHIHIISLINRLKFYQTVLTATCVPGTALLNFTEIIDWDILQATTTFSVGGCCLLYPIGYFTNKFVGYLYYNEDTCFTRIAYIDFWGRRKDVEIPSKELVPIEDLPVTPFDKLYLTLRTFSGKESWKLNMLHGVILDSDKIKHVL